VTPPSLRVPTPGIVPTSSPVLAALGGRCPRCGQGHIFAGGLLSLTVAPTCDRCGLDLAFVDPGDGPAVFAIMILGFLMLGTALFVEFRFNPPLWVHVVVFAPLTVLAAVGLLRPLKGVLIGLQYRHKAGGNWRGDGGDLGPPSTPPVDR
jgi:uncharacterized protein (DUF983 family)